MKAGTHYRGGIYPFVYKIICLWQPRISDKMLSACCINPNRKQLYFLLDPRNLNNTDKAEDLEFAKKQRFHAEVFAISKMDLERHHDAPISHISGGTYIMRGCWWKRSGQPARSHPAAKSQNRWRSVRSTLLAWRSNTDWLSVESRVKS